MRDTADDEIDDDGRSNTREAAADVPRDAAWEMITQTPVVEDRPDGLTTAIVNAVAEVEGVSPVDVKHPPLYDVIDVPALESSFFGSDGVSRPRDGESTTEFLYRDHRVVVTSDGWVAVHDRVED